MRLALLILLLLPGLLPVSILILLLLVLFVLRLVIPLFLVLVLFVILLVVLLVLVLSFIFLLLLVLLVLLVLSVIFILLFLLILLVLLVLVLLVLLILILIVLIVLVRLIFVLFVLLLLLLQFLFDISIFLAHNLIIGIGAQAVFVAFQGLLPLFVLQINIAGIVPRTRTDAVVFAMRPGILIVLQGFQTSLLGLQILAQIVNHRILTAVVQSTAPILLGPGIIPLLMGSPGTAGIGLQSILARLGCQTGSQEKQYAKQPNPHFSQHFR